MERIANGGFFGLRLIGAFKLLGALLLAAAGLGMFRLWNKDVGEAVERAVIRLRLDPENRLVHGAIARLSGITHARLKAIEAGTFFYAALELAEGVGLLLRRKWASYLTVVATGLLLPLEVYEIAHKVNATRVGVLLVNLAVLAYVIYRLRRERRKSVGTPVER